MSSCCSCCAALGVFCKACAFADTDNLSPFSVLPFLWRKGVISLSFVPCKATFDLLFLPSKCLLNKHRNGDPPLGFGLSCEVSFVQIVLLTHHLVAHQRVKAPRKRTGSAFRQRMEKHAPNTPTERNFAGVKSAAIGPLDPRCTPHKNTRKEKTYLPQIPIMVDKPGLRLIRPEICKILPRRMKAM